MGQPQLSRHLGRSASSWPTGGLGRHLFEFDGHLKYLRPERGGIAEDPDEVLWREKKRQGWLTGFRLGTSRVTWVDLGPEHWRATGIRLVCEHAATTAAPAPRSRTSRRTGWPEARPRAA